MGMSQYVQIYDNDTQEMLLNRVRRNDKVIKLSADQTKFFMYNDIALGARQIPLPLKSTKSLNNWVNDMNLSEISSSKSFNVFEVNGNRYVQVDGKAIGEQMIVVDMS